MAMMMSPVFNVPPPNVGAPPFRGGPPNVPVLFNSNMPPPSFDTNVSSMSRSGDLGNAIGPNQNQIRNAASNLGINPANVLPAFLTRSYRFKPPATVNLAEAEGYGRRLRRNMAQVRRHIDGVASVLNYLEDRVWQNGRVWEQRALQPHMLYSMEAAPPNCGLDKPVDCVTTKFVRSAMNKVKCPIYDICWTPEGRRLVTGASSGEFTLWNGTAFNFETILQAHDTAVRAIKWSHNDLWMVSADHDGYIKYWQANMNNVTMFQAHKEAVRSISFCPSDVKFATASDDGTVRVWDFIRCREEHILRGHGSDVRCVDWHPRKALLVSGSRDSQQPVKLWDPRSGHCLATLHDHKNAVMATQWNENGNWLITGSRDHLIKLYDIRMMKDMMTFRGHKKEVTSLAWHPAHEGLLVSGGADGALMFWSVTNDKEIGVVENAHEQAIWTLKWHPLGHILASGSNDNNTKFWARNKPGDTLEEFYFVTAGLYDNAAAQRSQLAAAPSVPSGQPPEKSWDQATNASTSTPSAAPSQPSKPIVSDNRKSAMSIIPGMGLDGEMFEKLREPAMSTTQASNVQISPSAQDSGIPGLGGISDFGDAAFGGRKTLLKQPPPKKAQRQFERVWNVNSQLQGATLGPADEGGPPSADTTDYRKPKPSLLGAPPPAEVSPQQQLPLLGSGPFDNASGGQLMNIPGLMAGHQQLSLDQRQPSISQSQSLLLDPRQPTPSQPSILIDPRRSSHPQQSSQTLLVDPRRSAHSQQSTQSLLDPRQSQQPQSLLSLSMTAPSNNGAGFGNQNFGSIAGGVSGSRSRSDDQDSDQELFGAWGGGGRGGGAPTNPKRKWKQEYEAEEAQGTTKRWAVPTDDDLAGAFPMDRDERPLWGRPSGGSGRR